MAVTTQQLAQLHAQSERGDNAGALAGIESALATDPKNLDAWHLAGIIRRRAGRGDEAIEAFGRAISGGLKSAELLNSFGLTFQELGRIEEAVEQFAAAVRLDPDYIPALVNAAKAKAAAGQWDAATKALRKVLRKFPNSTIARNALALILSEKGDAESAAKEYRTIFASNPSELPAAIRLGKALRDLGRSEEALEHLRRGQEKFSTSAEYVEALSGALVDCGRVSEAEAALEDLVQREPGYFSGHRALARLAREHVTGKDPYRTYRAISRRWPREQSIWLDWVQLMLAYRDYSMVVDCVAEAEAQSGVTAPLSYFKAIALGETGDAETAERLFSAIEPTAGGVSAFLAARARNAIRRGAIDAAQEWLTSATTSDPHDLNAWAYLGLAWRLLDDEREFWLHDYEAQVQQLTIGHLGDPVKMEKLRECLRSLHNATHHPPEQSLRGGTQTAGALFMRPEPEIVQLRDAIRESVETFAHSLPSDENHPFYRRESDAIRFIGSWSVRLHGEGYHIAHLHQEGWISSALHLSMPELAEGEPDDAGCLTLGQPPADLGLDLPPRRVVRPIEGSLVLFPSSMWHGTVPFRGSKERLTVAFDAVPV